MLLLHILSQHTPKNPPKLFCLLSDIELVHFEDDHKSKHKKDNIHILRLQDELAFYCTRGFLNRCYFLKLTHNKLTIFKLKMFCRLSVRCNAHFIHDCKPTHTITGSL